MKDTKIVYSEPEGYFPKKIREKHFGSEKPTAKKKPRTTVTPRKFIIQNSSDQNVSYNDIVKKVNKAYKDKIRTLDIYVKSEEGKAYYVINGDVTGAVDIFE